MRVDRTVPPHSVEAEMSTLGAMMISERGGREVLGIVGPEDFYLPVHQTVFKAIAKILSENKPADLPLLRQSLGSKMDEIGGELYLFELAEAVPSAHNAPYYAEIVADFAALRRASEVCRQGDSLIFDPDVEPKEKLDWLQTSIGGIRTGKRPWRSASEIIAGMRRTKPQALKTCWPSLDQTTSFRGLTKGEPHLIQADTGLGKSLLVSQLAKKWAIDDALRVAVVSLEFTDEFFMRRVLFQMTGLWSLEEAQDTGLGAFEAYQKAIAEYEYSDLVVYDYSGSKLGSDRSIETVLSDLSAFMARQALDAVLIDYVQLLERRQSRGGFADHNRNAHDLKWFAKHTGVCLVEASQVKLKDGRLQNRGGQEYEDAAASVLKLTYDERDGYRLNSTKARHGKKSFVELELNEKRLTLVEPEPGTDTVYRGGE